jgi:hypothetical protein
MYRLTYEPHGKGKIGQQVNSQVWSLELMNSGDDPFIPIYELPSLAILNPVRPRDTSNETVLCAV